MAKPTFVVIGGGIVGLAAAYKLSLRLPDARVTVLEKEGAVGAHQSGHNSGVLHCGLPYKPGTLKARLAVDGVRQMRRFCETHGIAHELCGKLVVAVTDDEVPRLRDLKARGEANGLVGLRELGPEAMREVEPHVGGVRGLLVPEEGIVDYPAVCDAMRRLLETSGHRVVCGARATAITRVGGAWRVDTPAGEFTADTLVNCAGLFSDRVAALAGVARDVRIVPFRGEYHTLRPERRHLVRNLIYPVADPRFPFLGVHFTRMIRGGVECGPNAVLATAREGYRLRDVDLGDLGDALSFPGLWRFLAKHPSMCARELAMSASKTAFCRALQRLVPALTPDDLTVGGAGVRAQAMTADGSLVEDFALVRGPGALHVVNAPSPGATASLAIADHVVATLSDAP